MACDPNFNDVVILLQMAGANGSTTFVDSSPLANPMTAIGATVDTAIQLGGLNSAAVGTSTAPAVSGISTPVTSGSPLNILGTNEDFTIEGFVYVPTGSSNVAIFDYCNQTAEYDSLGLCLEFSITGGTLSLHSPAGSGWGSLSGNPSSPALNTWYHFAVVRTGTVGSLYFNGNLVATTSSGGAWTYNTFTLQSGVTANFGGSAFTSSEGAVNLTDIRVTAGLARYSGSTYTIPTPPFGLFCYTTIPNVVGLSDTAAQAALTGMGFTVGTITTVANAAAPMQVIAQSPVGGLSAPSGTTVNLTESLGLVIPNVVNTSIPVATATLTGADFVLGSQTVVPSGIVLAGNIISQLPAAGTYAAGGTPVNVVVSGGLPPLTVPDLFGMTAAAAVTLLESLGLTVGSIGSMPSDLLPPGEVATQNPSAGAPIANGTIVSFVLSIGQAPVITTFAYEATVISQYANSPTIMQLIENFNEYFDQSVNFANFLSYVWNVDTAQGFGLDILGTIVNVGRLLQIPNTTDYVGFYMSSESQPDQDWQPMGSDQTPGGPVGGQMYTGYNATEAYLLPDDAYRQLILAKAFANICVTTAPAINQILQNLYGPGTAFVLNTGPMAISYNLTFTPTAIQLAILEQSGVIPTPPGVAVTINTGV